METYEQKTSDSYLEDVKKENDSFQTDSEIKKHKEYGNI